MERAPPSAFTFATVVSAILSKENLAAPTSNGRERGSSWETGKETTSDVEGSAAGTAEIAGGGLLLTLLRIASALLADISGASVAAALPAGAASWTLVPAMLAVLATESALVLIAVIVDAPVAVSPSAPRTKVQPLPTVRMPLLGTAPGPASTRVPAEMVVPPV